MVTWTYSKTQVRLKNSVYAQRMFEIVSMFYNRGQRQFSYPFSKLKTILNCPETYRYNDFTLNALEVAQRELQQKANLHLDWEPSIKQGKRIVELTFSIKTTHQLSAEGPSGDQSDAYSRSDSGGLSTYGQL